MESLVSNAMAGPRFGTLLLGIAENLVRGYATFASKITGFGASVPFVLLLVGLALTTREQGRRGVLNNEGPPPTDYTSDLTRWRVAAVLKQPSDKYNLRSRLPNRRLMSCCFIWQYSQKLSCC